MSEQHSQGYGFPCRAVDDMFGEGRSFCIGSSSPRLHNVAYSTRYICTEFMTFEGACNVFLPSTDCTTVEWFSGPRETNKPVLNEICPKTTTPTSC